MNAASSYTARFMDMARAAMSSSQPEPANQSQPTSAAPRPVSGVPTVQQLVALKVTSRATSQPPGPAAARIIHPRERFASAEAVRGSVRLSKGAARLWELLHFQALEVALQRRYSHTVSWVVFALPQSLAAAALGYTDRHIRNLQGELEAAGLLDSHALADKVKGENLWATTLWAVKTTTRDNTPRLTHEDYGHEWRNFEADLKARNTAQRIISGLQTMKESERVYVLLSCIVTGIFSLKTRYVIDRKTSLSSVKDALYGIGMLGPPDGRTRENVGALAAVLAHGFGDDHSFRWWAAQLWKIAGNWEAVGAFQAQLSRLLTDCAEAGHALRNPGALFASRQTSRPA